jgi:KRAB domain-containing zinc finger protein
VSVKVKASKGPVKKGKQRKKGRPKKKKLPAPPVEDVRILEEEEDLTCAKCGEEFTDKNKYWKHKWKHNRKKSHVCDVCGKAFYMRYELEGHKHLHTGEKPYVCQVCGAAYQSHSSFAAHKR